MEIGLILLFLVFFAGIVMGVPVAFTLGLAALAGFLWEGISPAVVFQQMTSGMSMFSLLAIPFFIFAGEIMMHGGIARRLIAVAAGLVGWMRGGLGLVNVAASMLFGGISGSAVADASALGTVLIPAMKQKGYDTDYAVNVTVTASIAGIMIPPSHNMILYSLAAGAASRSRRCSSPASCRASSCAPASRSPPMCWRCGAATRPSSGRASATC
ncbi:TRAP transporter large permease subunit [Teichococcus aestuarii]|uniref:TRAP transporter large permease subunit n=1 Tax=Teichococcus aestuarii TaxID=568898 RepID=UPI003621BA49